MMGAVSQQRIFLIDAFGFIFRAYHARARSGAPPMRTSTGLSTEAVYIFNNMLRKLAKQHNPPYIAAVFESGEPTHRVQEFPEYKANRAGDASRPGRADSLRAPGAGGHAHSGPRVPGLRSRRRDRHAGAARGAGRVRSGDRIER